MLELDVHSWFWRECFEAATWATVLINELGYTTLEVSALAANEDGEELFGLRRKKQPS